jgi:hypothetical protein
MFVICSNKNGFAAYSEWKRVWSKNGSTEANIKLFFVDQYLPCWVQCNACSKWRQLPRETALTSQFVKDFVCANLTEVSPRHTECIVSKCGLNM